MEASTPPPTTPPTNTPITSPDRVAKSNKIAMFVILGLVVVVALVVAFFLAGSETKEEMALANVCAARADIQDRIDSLVTTDLADFRLGQFKTEFAAIQADIKTIKDNQADLEIERGQQVDDATSQFTATLRATAGSLLTSTSIKNAPETLQTASSELATGYRAALEQIDCSGVDGSN